LSIRGLRLFGIRAWPWVIVLLGKCVGRGDGGFLTELTRLTDLTKWQDDSGAGSRYAEVLWLFGFATRLFLKLYKLFGYFVPVFHQFCFLFGISPVV